MSGLATLPKVLTHLGVAGPLVVADGLGSYKVVTPKVGSLLVCDPTGRAAWILVPESPAEPVDAEGLGAASSLYKRFHGREAKHIIGTHVPSPGRAKLLGIVALIRYAAKKRGDRELVTYEHAFDPPRQPAIYSIGGGGYHIAPGAWRVRAEGITNTRS